LEEVKMEVEEVEEVEEVDGANWGREDKCFSRFRSLALNFSCFPEESSPDSFEEFPEGSSGSA
jgi:hypothetical protein